MGKEIIIGVAAIALASSMINNRRNRNNGSRNSMDTLKKHMYPETEYSDFVRWLEGLNDYEKLELHKILKTKDEGAAKKQQIRIITHDINPHNNFVDGKPNEGGNTGIPLNIIQPSQNQISTERVIEILNKKRVAEYENLVPGYYNVFWRTSYNSDKKPKGKIKGKKGKPTNVTKTQEYTQHQEKMSLGDLKKLINKMNKKHEENTKGSDPKELKKETQIYEENRPKILLKDLLQKDVVPMKYFGKRIKVMKIFDINLKKEIYYILDGHHHWAALVVGLNNKSLKVPVRELTLPTDIDKYYQKPKDKIQLILKIIQLAIFRDGNKIMSKSASEATNLLNITDLSGRIDKTIEEKVRKLLSDKDIEINLDNVIGYIGNINFYDPLYNKAGIERNYMPQSDEFSRLNIFSILSAGQLYWNHH